MARHNEALTAAMSERGIPVTDLIGNIFVDSERYDSDARVIHVGAHALMWIRSRRSAICCQRDIR